MAWSAEAGHQVAPVEGKVGVVAGEFWQHGKCSRSGVPLEYRPRVQSVDALLQDLPRQQTGGFYSAFFQQKIKNIHNAEC